MEKLHPKAVWLFFFRYFFMVGIFMFAIIVYLLMSLIEIMMTMTRGISMPYIPIIVILGFPLYGVFCYFWAKLTYRFWYYELSENAIKIEKGVILKKYISIPYERIQNVDIYRGIFARILGLSELHIQTAGYSGYGKYGRGTEGRLSGLDPKIAEQLREELVKRIKGTKQGL